MKLEFGRKKVDLNLWDTPGDEKFKDVVKQVHAFDPSNALLRIRYGNNSTSKLLTPNWFGQAMVKLSKPQHNIRCLPALGLLRHC